MVCHRDDFRDCTSLAARSLSFVAALLVPLLLSAQSARPAPQPPVYGTVVTAVSCEIISDHIGVVIAVRSNVPYRAELLHNPHRLYLDLTGAAPARKDLGVNLGACRSLVERVRIAEHEPGTTRVVLDLSQPVAYAIGPSGPQAITISLKPDIDGRVHGLSKAETHTGELRTKTTPLPPPSPPSRASLAIATLSGAVCQSNGDESKVVIEVEPPVLHRSDMLHNPDRLYFDFLTTTVGSGVHGTKVCTPLVDRIHIGEHGPGVARVVFYLKRPVSYATSPSKSPPGVIVSLREVGPAITTSRGETHQSKKGNAANRVPLTRRTRSAVAGKVFASDAERSSESEMLASPPPIDDVLSVVKRADNGDAEAQAALGHAHESGELGGVHYSQAFHWYERAAEQGNVYAAIRLGDMYANGIGTGRNPEQAAHYYQAVAPVSELARTRLRGLTGPGNKPVEIASRSVPPNTTPSSLSTKPPSLSAPPMDQPTTEQSTPPRTPATLAGERVNQGRPLQAESHASSAIPEIIGTDQLRNLHARPVYLAAMAGSLYVPSPSVASAAPERHSGSHGFEYDVARVPRDPAAAVKWYQNAAVHGIADAQFALGNIYLEGRGTAKDPAKAAMWYRRAAEQGNAAAQNNLGLLYLKGSGVRKSPVEAVRWFAKSAEAGDLGGQNNLGAAYVNGSGVLVDYAEGAKWLRKAADQGSIESQYALGTLYATGRGVSQDPAAAVQWFARAANQGYARAELMLGKMCLAGQGTARDYTQARQWFERAAAQDLPEADFALGQIFREGLGVAPNGPEAVTWYQRAAKARDAAAQYALGEIYSEGKLVTPDPVLAYAWFALAASNGHERGLKAINTIAPKMTISQIAAAQQRAYALAAQVAASRQKN